MDDIGAEESLPNQECIFVSIGRQVRGKLSSCPKCRVQHRERTVCGVPGDIKVASLDVLLRDIQLPEEALFRSRGQRGQTLNCNF